MSDEQAEVWITSPSGTMRWSIPVQRAVDISMSLMQDHGDPELVAKPAEDDVHVAQRDAAVNVLAGVLDEFPELRKAHATMPQQFALWRAQAVRTEAEGWTPVVVKVER